MAKNILVATSQPAFGELLRLSLEESGRYRVRLVQTGRQALSSAEHILFSLAILDATLDEPPFLYVAQGLRKHQPGVRLLVIPSQTGETAADVDAVQPDGCISQPFYAPSLLETINALTSENDAPVDTESNPPSKTPIAPAPPHPAGTIPPNMQDAALATHHLEEFLKDSTAPGVILLRMRQPWATAGQLNQEALHEVANLLTRYTAANEGVDLARYIHLQSDGSEYLIYATPLADSQVLAMVYQITTPLTVIRAQAGRLARLLRQVDIPAQVVLTAAGPAPAPENVVAQAPAAPPPAPLDEGALLDESETADAVLEAEAMRLTDLLADLPAPDPQKPPKPETDDWVKGEAAPEAEESGFLFPWETPQAPASPVPTQTAPQPTPASPPAEPVTASAPPAPKIPLPQPAEQPQTGPVISTPPLPPEPAPVILTPPQALQPAPALRVELAPVAPPPPAVVSTQPHRVEAPQNQAAAQVASASVAQTMATPVAPAASATMPVQRNPDPPSIEQTRPVISRAGQQSFPPVDPAMPTFSNLAYTCLLLPRLPSHTLTSFLGQRLSEWLPQLCIAYSWRLEGLWVQPDFMQWTVQVAPAISPGNVIRLIRQQTSRRVFMQFPQLEVENPSGDFWASGYLIISGSQPPSPHLVQDFIRQTRLRQGSMYP